MKGGIDEGQPSPNKTSAVTKPADSATLQRPAGSEWFPLFAVVFVLASALTVLDLALSRPTKPWRFLLRIVYRFGRSHLKLSPVWLAFHATGLSPQELGRAFSQVSHCITDWQLFRQVALTFHCHAKWLTVAFFAYALLVRWTFLRFFMRPVDNSGNSSAETRPSNRPSGFSRWWLIIECLFRPISLATAHTLADFDLELDETMDLFFERLVFPNLWLTPTIPADYLQYLPIWKSNGEPPNSSHVKWIASNECAICLDKYKETVDVCGLPCGHHFHESCIMSWLERDNHHCPICRKNE